MFSLIYLFKPFLPNWLTLKIDPVYLSIYPSLHLSILHTLGETDMFFSLTNQLDILVAKGPVDRGDEISEALLRSQDAVIDFGVEGYVRAWWLCWGEGKEMDGLV